MKDTPPHIKEIQRKIWLSKTPEERLLQFITENEAWWNALREARKQQQLKNNKKSGGS